MRKRTDGFTLVELMVVVLVIGILVAVAVPVFNAAKAEAGKKACQANQRAWMGAVEACIAAGERPTMAPSGGEGAWVLGPSNQTAGWYNAIIGKYVKAVPRCPAPPSGAVSGPGIWALPSQSWYDGMYYSCSVLPNGSGVWGSGHKLISTIPGPN